MSNEIAIEVKALPAVLQSALRSVGYGARSISVRASETASLSVAGGEGRKGFAVVCNLATGERREIVGSWGGANIFESSPVDCDRESRPMPENGAIVRGSTGYKGTWAFVEVHPAAFAPLLPAPVDAAPVTEKESHILYGFRALKGGEYRRSYLRDINASDAEVTSLVTRGFLSRNKAGATSITTSGINAASRNGASRCF